MSEAGLRCGRKGARHEPSPARSAARMALLSLPPCPDGAVARSQPMLEPPIQREVYTLTTWSAQPANGDGDANGADSAPAPMRDA